MLRALFGACVLGIRAARTFWRNGQIVNRKCDRAEAALVRSLRRCDFEGASGAMWKKCESQLRAPGGPGREELNETFLA